MCIKYFIIKLLSHSSGVSSYKICERMETAKSERKIEKERSKESGKEYFTAINSYLFSLERFSAFCHFLTSPDEGRHSKCCGLSSLAWSRFLPPEIPLLLDIWVQ